MRRILNWLRDYEPAQLQAFKAAALAILAVVGVSLGTDVLDGVEFWTGVGAVVLTQAQAIMTRFGVFAPATVRKIEQGSP